MSVERGKLTASCGDDGRVGLWSLVCPISMAGAAAVLVAR